MVVCFLCGDIGVLCVDSSSMACSKTSIVIEGVDVGGYVNLSVDRRLYM